jgi:hypothetical protein
LAHLSACSTSGKEKPIPLKRRAAFAINKFFKGRFVIPSFKFTNIKPVETKADTQMLVNNITKE